jgi:histidine triad (HIT) family protein
VADCVFCDIIAKRADAARVFEDSEFIGIMDKHPINPGHVLVLPKQHYATIFDMPMPDVGQLFSRATEVAHAVRATLGCEGLNMGQNNGSAAAQIVPHVHVHVIPRYREDLPPGRWPTRRLASLDELQQTAEMIRRALSGPPDHL